MFDRDCGWQALKLIDLRAFELFGELPRVGRDRIEEAALAFGKKDVEGEGGFSRARKPGDHDELIARDVEREVFEVVMTRAAQCDGVGGRWNGALFGRLRSWCGNGAGFADFFQCLA